MVKLVKNYGLWGLVKHSYRYINYVSVLAFIERWQPETNSFHKPFSEMTITLNDLYHLLNIPIVGKPAYGVVFRKVEDKAEKIKWLTKYIGCSKKETLEECKSLYSAHFDWLMQQYMEKVKKLGRISPKETLSKLRGGTYCS